ncbi:hypothetical protein COT49_00005 [candidate division WWE3 bacterium CG08_land_8_20_14_0_20_40_13]|uniref:Sortase n=1 Tax=candidate division WWE3 bacterium CG08_land_8_20_14_0_20_40_13 TaxID=1975084 RepID=A0A2H0XEU6_UNCKA|nr:MAG: hypothetical protein COT49_00005 [candidate division WWE3 bacterium CG08_land_8_20_14_0_20_40_13]
MNTQDIKFITVRVISNILILGAIAVIALTYGPWAWGNLVLIATKARGVTWQLSNSGDSGEKSLIRALIDQKPLAIAPINEEFSIVVPRIGLSVPVVKNVSIADKKQYLDALRSGVAHARGSAVPGRSGNVYLFAHSGVDFWELGPYAGSFNLLNRLTPGDEIMTFYENKRYIYKVVQTEIVKGWDTIPYYRDFVRPMMTLQTCDPPGTTLNRLLVLAELVE